MPFMAKTETVAANTRSGNCLAGQLFEFVGVPSGITLACTSESDGVTCDFTIGGVQVVNNAEIPKNTSAPKIPDDTLEAVGANAGSRLFLAFTNPTAQPATIRWRVNVDPV